MDTLTALVILIVFISTLTRSTFGFGEALIAMPLLSFVVGVKVAAPVVALVGLANSTAILSTDWRSVEWKGAWRLIASGIVGIPLGVYSLTSIPENAVKLVLAAVVIGFSVYNLTRPRLPKLDSDQPAFGFGFVAGVLGGAYNTPGPPVIIFGTLRQWSAKQFRSTFQCVLLPTGLFVVVGHGAAGLWSGDVFHFVLYSLPVILITAPLGKRLNRLVDGKAFLRVIHVLLLVIGIMLLVTALW